MANTFNTDTYLEEYQAILQERLTRPTTWRQLTKVIMGNFRTDHFSYISTMPAIQSGTRGTASSAQDYTITDTALTLSTYRELMVFIDRADEAQVNYPLRMELAERQGELINEVIESLWLADHANWTNFGLSDVGGGGTSDTVITVTASNIATIVRGLRREVRQASGQGQMKRNGFGIGWRPEDFELLEQFAMANGFNLADLALKDGVEEGYKLFGVEHYFTNDNAANHVFAGVKNICQTGLLSATWSQLDVINNPAGGSGGNLSGTGLRVRSDSGLRVPAGLSTIVFDLRVA